MTENSESHKKPLKAKLKQQGENWVQATDPADPPTNLLKLPSLLCRRT